MGWIYRWTHKASGMSYIGQTTDIKRRIKDHGKYYGHCRYLHNAIKAHGIEAFEIDIICEVPDELLNTLEICYIKVLNTLSPTGYNLREGGNEGKPSNEVRTAISERMTGNLHGLGNQNRLGIPHTPEAKQRISISGKGRQHSKSTRKQMSEKAQGENNAFYGKSHTKEAREQMSRSQKERWAKRKNKQ